MTYDLWNTKLASWLHDPAEKCFVLFHDPAGHEGGTIKHLKEELNLTYNEETINLADRLAASADRPQWPRDEQGGWQEQYRVDFSKEPILIHPLTGEQLKLYDLTQIDYKQLKLVSENNFKQLLELGQNDRQMQFLALWRFAPEIKELLGKLWNLLPADTRVPDHSIWNHLDLTSAFAGAINDDKPAILAMAIGPVQGFIAKARSTSDLWAGSHLLSCLAWEGMKVIANEIGPDAFMFPQLRGVPIVDKWLLELADSKSLGELWQDKFNSIGADWLKKTTDANPLFIASLPNKFSAVVPQSRAEELANKAAEAIRNAAKEWATEAAKYLKLPSEGYYKQQIEEQLENFPNVYWASVNWPSDCTAEKLAELKEACSVFFNDTENFFKKPYFQCVNREISLDGKEFYKPNAGILYPAVYGLSEKALAASKTAREFQQLKQTGFRCTLCGEREWLTENQEMLNIHSKQDNNSAYSNLAGTYGIKDGERLCAVCTLKRFWPKLFASEAAKYLDKELQRFVISTRTMSLTPTLTAITENINSANVTNLKEEISKKGKSLDGVALPKKLYKFADEKNSLEMIKKIPALLDHLAESDKITAENEKNSLESLLKKATIKQDAAKKETGIAVETYYALILMDGDNMGAWLSGSDNDKCIEYQQSWHEKIRCSASLINGGDALKDFTKQKKPATQGKHAAISSALNGFATTVVSHIVEEHCGMLIYAGGDDVLAMAPTDEVLPLIKDLRLAYSGIGNQMQNSQTDKYKKNELYKQNGFVLLNNKLMMSMGSKATASVGVVIAHHSMPLAYALKCLREAEHTAKENGRNSFCIRILKRAGGEISFTDKWWLPQNEADKTNKPVPKSVEEYGFSESESIGLFEELVKIGANDNVSRKAFYGLSDWLHLLKSNEVEYSKGIAEALLEKQFKSHGFNKVCAGYAHKYSKNVIDMALKYALKANKAAPDGKAKNIGDYFKRYLESMLYCAEFFARETRNYKQGETNK